VTELRWKAGGVATIAKLEGERVELVSSRAWPPGSRPDGVISLGGGAESPIWFKIFNARREADGNFRLTGRLLDATVALRTAIERMLAPPPTE
jgi:hypothetical protein